jgi:hypothetical protein
MNGTIINISQLLSNALFKSNSIKPINAVVKPQPGQWTPNSDFHKQGIHISMSATAFNIAENKK